MCWLLSVIVESQPLLVLSLVPPRAPWFFQLFFDRQSIKARCTLSAPSNPSLMIGGRGMEVDWDKNTHWPTDAALPSKKFPKHQMWNSLVQPCLLHLDRRGILKAPVDFFKIEKFVWYTNCWPRSPFICEKICIDCLDQQVGQQVGEQGGHLGCEDRTLDIQNTPWGSLRTHSESHEIMQR